MSESNGWGGKREGAGSGGPRPGAGRPRTRWDTKGQREWYVTFSPIDGFPSEPQRWRLLNIDADGTLEFQNIETEEIISIIHPDEYL